MAARIDLNSDLGEGIGDDDALFAVVSSASIACGVHAGDAAIMRASCLVAAREGIAVGAHPSYNDREGFGRRAVDVDPATLVDELVAQIAVLDEHARAAGTRVRYVKPHGALYNRAAVDAVHAAALARAVREIDDALPVLGPPGSELAREARRLGLTFRIEAFIDRGYTPEGTLAPRGAQGALITDAARAADRALQLATTGRVDALDGTSLLIDPDSLCLHGDTPGAGRVARAVRAALDGAGVQIGAFA